jgi:uncharacterized membrane protein YhaH (DUF805 family)
MISAGDFAMFEYFLSPSGRIGRAKWWLAQPILITVIGVCIWQLYLIFRDKTLDGNEKGIVGAIVVVWLLAIWFNFCITAKRYHDRNKSAWWFLFQLVPLIGPIWALIELGFLGGDLSDNDFGPGHGFNIDSDLEEMMGESQAFLAGTSAAPVLTARPNANYPANGGKPVFGRRT